MKRNRFFSCTTCLVALLLLAGMADAVTVTAKFIGANPAMNVRTYADRDNDPAYELDSWTRAGVHVFEAISSDFEPIQAGETFTTFCIDLGQYVNSNGIYTYTVTDIKNAPVPTTYSMTTIGGAQELDLQKLYSQYYGVATQGLVLDAAAFQAAAWEIVNEHWLDYDVLDGSFKVQSDWSAAPLANTWLDSLAGYSLPEGPLPNLTAFVSECSQDQMFIIPGGGGQIPEPLTLMGLLMGLGVVSNTLRRRRMS